MSGFKKAVKSRAKLRLAIIGPAGAGKTYSALAVATALSPKVAVIDTEHGSASKYADLFAFDVLEPDNFSPDTYVQALEAAAQAGYEVIVIDSLSHAWAGKGGALEMVDAAAARSRSGNNFAAWRDVTPHHNALVEALVTCPCHVIATMRSKTDYVQEKDERGKTVIRKVGLAPVQRDGLEYEFDVVGDIDHENRLIISKTRIPALNGSVIQKPGKAFADQLSAWLNSGQIPPAIAKRSAPPPTTAPDNGGCSDDLPASAELRERITCALASLSRTWDNPKTKQWAAGILGRPIGDTDGLDRLTNQEGEYLLDEINTFAKKLRDKANVPAAAPAGGMTEWAANGERPER